MYCLVDVNGMYAACEAVFDPSLRKRPVVVLSNNDATVIAVNDRAKRLGVKKFIPYFQSQELLEQIGAAIKSSNYELYSDLSWRFHSVCAAFAPQQFIYSIDESFLLYSDGFCPDVSWSEHARQIRKTVWKQVRLPVGVGIGPTPTLAKAANHASKRIEGYVGVAVIDSEQSRRTILSQMEARDVWGIGPRLSERLNTLGIYTALELAQLTPRRAKHLFNIGIESTVHELNGRVMLTWDEIRAPKQQIYSTRTFGRRVTEVNILHEAVASHVHTVTAKLRRQRSLCGVITVFASSSPHGSESPYSRSLSAVLPGYSSDTRVLLEAARRLSNEIYQKGVMFYRCGVGLLDIVEAEQHQPDLFTPNTDDPRLMACMDSINAKYGKGTLFCASQGVDRKFEMRREFLSRRYTTCLSDLPVIKC